MLNALLTAHSGMLMLVLLNVLPLWHSLSRAHSSKLSLKPFLERLVTLGSPDRMLPAQFTHRL